jgi:hypothetical protein
VPEGRTEEHAHMRVAVPPQRLAALLEELDHAR